MINLSSGVQWERLMLWADEDVEAAGFEALDVLAKRFEGRPRGHEFGFVLSGTLRVIVGFDEFVLEPGDSITFPSTTPHRLSNDGPETVRAVWVVRGRRGAEDAREQTESPVATQAPAGNGRASGGSGS
jgi:mannose-6-phosphate isomerase-like protein (cupin superfamily)